MNAYAAAADKLRRGSKDARCTTRQQVLRAAYRRYTATTCRCGVKFYERGKSPLKFFVSQIISQPKGWRFKFNASVALVRCAICFDRAVTPSSYRKEAAYRGWARRDNAARQTAAREQDARRRVLNLIPLVHRAERRILKFSLASGSMSR